MTLPIIDAPVRWWRCPSCDVTSRTQRNDVHIQYHSCGAFNGLTMPLIETRDHDDKPDGIQRAVSREDYVGDEILNPLAGTTMSIVTEHGDGSSDCTIYAPTAAIEVT